MTSSVKEEVLLNPRRVVVVVQLFFCWPCLKKEDTDVKVGATDAEREEAVGVVE